MWAHLTCQEQAASHEQRAMQPEDRLRLCFLPVHSRIRQGSFQRALKHRRNGKQCQQPRHTFGFKPGRSRNRWGRLRRLTRTCRPTLAHIFHTACHAAGGCLLDLPARGGHGTQQTCRNQRGAEHGSEKLGVHICEGNRRQGVGAVSMPIHPHNTDTCPNPSKKLGVPQISGGRGGAAGQPAPWAESAAPLGLVRCA